MSRSRAPDPNSHSPPPETVPFVPLEDGIKPYRDSYALSTIPSPHPGTEAGTPDTNDLFDPLGKEGYVVPGHQIYIPPSLPNNPGPALSRRRKDLMLFASISIMILWPWVFFGIISGLGGVQWPNSSARYVIDRPARVTFIVTLIGSVVRLISGLLFSLSIVRFGQEWIARNNPHVTVFDISLLSAFRNQSWVWGVNEWKHLISKSRVVRVVMVGLSLVGFALIPSGTASLIAPTTFNKTAPLSGTELNFASGDAACFSWLDGLPNSCDWEVYNGTPYATCLSGYQMVDILESGRGSMQLLLPNRTGTFTLSQIGGNDGLHFLGHLRGVLPIGPDGVSAFGSLQTAQNPFADPGKVEGMVSYNYTLEHQGLDSTIKCIYDTSSPIVFGPVDDTVFVLQYNGTCDPALGVETVLKNVVTYPALNSNNTLGYWACKSAETTGGAPSYFIYLRGRVNYATAIGNITCTVSPAQLQTFATMFRSQLGSFTATKLATNVSSESSLGGLNNATYPGIVEGALVGLGDIIWEGQSWDSNLIVDSVVNFGVKWLGLNPYQKNETYLRLYEAMIQGVLEYAVTYSRLTYAGLSNPPQSCIRSVPGTVTYEVVGWYARSGQGGFLVPMTLVDIASLVILVIAMIIGEGEYDFDPTDTRPLLTAELECGRPTTVEWTDEVRYSQVPLHGHPM